MDEKSDRHNEALSRIDAARRRRATKLSLSGLGLSELPESIAHLTQLQELDIADNQLTELPEFIGQLTRLKVLDVSGTHLTEWPEVISGLSQLEHLRIWGNWLTRLPESIGQLTQLQTLYLSSNQLTELPESIGELTRLQVLHVSGNQLTEWPEAVSRLSQLERLYLQGNNLTELRESLSQLTHLQVLHLSMNQLTELPEGIGRLTQLREVDLSSNHLKALPKTLCAAEQLTSLYLHGNKELGLPEEVLGPRWLDVYAHHETPANPKEILDYYFRIRKERRPLNEAKLILVGRGGVGKTSLVNRLVHDQFAPAEKETDGIATTTWDLRLHGTEDVRLNVWDFGGQEIMHATHQFFLTQRSLYLLVLNGREGGEDADAEYWLKLIESFGGGSPVIVVLNKIREHPFDLNRRALEQKYPIREFVKTDCEDKTGIKELRKAIERETDRLEHLRDAFPASWFTIKERLGKMPQYYLSFKEYRSFCEQHGEMDDTAQEELAGYLNNLGIALNYRGDPRLQHTHVLKPNWVTNGIYKILNSARLEAQKGEIRLGDLRKILDEDEYPPDMQRFVIDLMKKFELCFSFPDDDTHYLIPELLDKQEPEATAEFVADECLNFQYHYPVLPEGLLPRVIVRTHVLSEGLPRWRSGVILKFEGNRALVKADVPERKVFISVAGFGSGRRRLLAVIRSDFERIHRDIRLKPLEIVPLPEHPAVVVSYEELQVMERRGLQVLPKVVGNEVVHLDIHGLLNGVDLEGTRKRDRRMDERRGAARLFYSYSHKDESLRNELETHLKLLQRQGKIETWHDRNIDAGDDWKQKIDDNLERADIILLLVSADFIASDYCYEKEMGRALEREAKGETLVIPIIVRDVSWHGAPFAGFQALPEDGKAVTKWKDRDSAWRSVSEGIEKVVEKISR